MVKIVTISGKARNGKDIFAQYMANCLYEEHGKNTQIIHFAEGVKEVARSIGWDGEKDQNGRALLQFVGTEWGRKKIAKNVWIKKAEQKIYNSTDIAIFPDARFVNEITYWIEQGYHVTPVRVVRLDEEGNEWDNGMGEKLKQHSSETSVDNFPFRQIIHHETLEHLKTAAEIMANGMIENV